MRKTVCNIVSQKNTIPSSIYSFCTLLNKVPMIFIYIQWILVWSLKTKKPETYESCRLTSLNFRFLKILFKI